jgi:hypothetical protein
MKGFIDEMVAVDKRLDDEDIISYILAGLDVDFNPFVEAFMAKTKPQTLNDLYSQMLIVEARVESPKEQQQINVNTAYRGGGRGGRGPIRGHDDGGSCGHGSHNSGCKIPCQVCDKTGHSALRCYKRFHTNYNGEEKHANAATTDYTMDTEWYTDMGATNHITSELDKLAICEKYNGSEQVHTASGSCMSISHVGHTTIHTPNHDLILKDILHVPSSSKNLVSVHKFTYDNNAFFEFHSWYFLLKDQGTKNLLLQGRCKNDLYPPPLVVWVSNQPPNKRVLAAVKPTMVRWQHRLGHVSPSIVHCVANKHSLSFSKESLDASMCDACQRVKRH